MTDGREHELDDHRSSQDRDLCAPDGGDLHRRKNRLLRPSRRPGAPRHDSLLRTQPRLSL